MSTTVTMRARRSVTFTVIAVLGLTVGLMAAALDVVAAFLWRPLPYPASDRLVAVDFPRVNGPGVLQLQRMDWSAVNGIADRQVAWDIDNFTVIDGSTPFAVDGRWISADAFDLFGVIPAAGRFFTAAEARRGEPLAVIGYRLWQTRFGGDPDAVGRSITIRATLRDSDRETFRIVGVLPARFWHLETQTDLLLPRASLGAPAFLQLKPGMTSREASARLTAVVQANVSNMSPNWSVQVRPAREAHVERIRGMLIATTGGVGLLGLVAVANLAFLQVAHGLARQRELAIKSTLGATGRMLGAQLLGEGLALGAAAAVVALAVCSVLLRVGIRAIEHYFGRVVPVDGAGLGRDPFILAGVVILSLSLGLFLAVIMLWTARSASLPSALAGHPSGTDRPARIGLTQLVIGVQVAIAFALLVAASLMIRTAWHLGMVNLGFEPQGVLSANVTLHEGTYKTTEQQRQFFRGLLDRLEQEPDIIHAGITDWLPFRVGPAFTIERDGGTPGSTKASIQGVNAAYFSALEIRLIEGRLMTAADRPGQGRIAVVSRALAGILWEHGSAIGQTFRIRFSDEPGRGFGPFTIVGVVEDSLRSLTETTPPQVYLSWEQQPRAFNAFLQLKTRRPPLELTSVVTRLVLEADASVPLANVDSLDRIVSAQGIRPRFLARVLAGFAALAMTVATIGLYAVSAWIARRRQREAALRIALGAKRRSVAMLLTRRGTIAVGCGLVPGWLTAGALSASIAPELHGVSASDALTRVFVGGLLVALSFVALALPAWRAATPDLMALLKVD